MSTKNNRNKTSSKTKPSSAKPSKSVRSHPVKAKTSPFSVPVSFSSSARKADPHAKREASNYANPLPSREFILDTMIEQG
ncbi:MAG TPA: hypothetical protein VGC12_07790, partial [Methyloradius sp.]